jgi:hypothetical protein
MSSKVPKIKTIKVPRGSKAKMPKQGTKKDGLYYQITESPIAKEFYDIITSDEVVTFSKDFLKVLISMWLYKTVYDATAPSRPAVETQTEPPRRGIVVQGRRGIVVEGRRDDDFGVAPIDVEDIIRSSGADISNLSESEQERLHDFIAADPNPEIWEEVMFQEPQNIDESELICNLTAESDKPVGCIGMGLMDDIKSFKLSSEAKKIGKDAFKALLLAGLAGAVGAYSVSSAENDRNLNYDAERTDPTYIPPKKASYDIEGRTKNWASEVKNKNIMNDILDEFSDISGDVSDIGHFSGTYGLGLKKTKKATKPIGKIEIPDVLKNPKIASINNRIEDAIKYIYNIALHSGRGVKGVQPLSKEVIMLFISVVFALGTALIFANSQTLTDSALDNIMNFTKIFEDCINGRVSLNSIQEYISHYTNYRGGKLIASHSGRGVKGVKSLPKKPKSSPKKSQSTDIPESFYQKRIKPITKHVYDILTSDETITVAKTLAQLTFLTLIMYGIKELGTAAYSSANPADQDTRSARQVLEELAEQEIARPTYYTEYGPAGRDLGIKEYDKSGYPRDWPTDVGPSRFSEIYEPPFISKVNRAISEADRDIYQSKAKTANLIEILKHEDPVHVKNIMLKHPHLRSIAPKKWDRAQQKYIPDILHPFTEEFREHIPTLKEKINWKKGQILSGKGLKEDAAELSKTTLAKLKKIAKKIYDKIRSEEGQDAVKGLTVATILTGLAALMHSRMGTQPRQLSPEELKEQYMESIGESVLF